MSLRRKAFIAAVILLLPVVLVAGAWLFLQSAWAERWVEARVSGQIQREVEIERIRIKPTWPPTVTLGKLRIANPPWASTPDLVNAEGITFTVEIPALFDKRIVVPFVQANVARAGIEQKGEQATWKFGDHESSPSRIDLERVLLEDGHIVYRVEAEDTALDIRVKGSLGAQGELALAAEGKFRGEPAKGTATIPALDANHPADPVRIVAKANLGRTQVSADGTFATDLKTYDMKLGLAGATLKDLHRTLGIVLPETPPYKLDGRLRHRGSEWVFDPFNGKVGDSDLRGSVVYAKGAKRPLFQANLQSALLDFDDLGPLVGAPPKTGAGETAAPEQRAKAAELKVTSRVLPRERFETEKWDDMDADVRLSAKRVLRPKQLPIDTLSAHLLLKDGVMRLEPLNFGIAGGRVTSNVSIDSRVQPPAAKIKSDVQGLQLSQFFPTMKTMEEALGTVYGKAELEGRGASVGDLLGTSSGKIVLAANGGRVSDLLVQLLEIDVARAAMLLGTRKQQVDLRCAVGSINVKDGVATPESFVVDTTETLVKVEGKLDFSQERFDLVTRGRGKSPSVFTLKSPIVLEGPLKKPSVHPKAGPIAAQVGAAIALGAANPALAILPFVETGRAENADCDKLLAEARSEGAVKKAS
jgi:uncharacterized protein involved in outer membrane biogenesis